MDTDTDVQREGVETQGEDGHMPRVMHLQAQGCQRWSACTRSQKRQGGFPARGIRGHLALLTL